MNEQETCKIIAKYMGWYDEPVDPRIPYEEISFYTKSLDALVPVVEKHCKELKTLYHINFFGEFAIVKAFRRHVIVGLEKDKSPSLALATACAKVIKELK